MLLEREYAERLEKLQAAPWKRFVDVQAPYRWNLRWLSPGRMLEIGCGIGRNLHIPGSIGVDPNPSCIAIARSRGFNAFTPDELREKPQSFDSLLIAHVLEHLNSAQVEAMLFNYLVYLKPRGKLILITPQERGFAPDSTHVRFVDFAMLHGIVAQYGFAVEKSYSFPFPRWAGRFFRYNEFVVTAIKQPETPRG